MKSLFVLRRPGVLVISGVIVELSTDQIVVENDCLFPISGQQKARCSLKVDEDTVEKMHLKIGASVIATVTDNFLVELLMEGGEPSEHTFSMDTYTIRYNGSFDFEEHMERKEEHVFCGTVLSASSGSKNGKNWIRMTIGWKRRGAEERRNVVFWNNGTDMADLTGKRMIIVAGSSRYNNGVTYYNASHVYEF